MADIDGEDVELDPTALARAEAALNALSGRYLTWARADLVRLAASLEQALADDGKSHLNELFSIAHDMKGQAATFGYPLISHLGNHLCRLIEAVRAGQQPSLTPATALVAAMDQILSEQLEGEGGETGRRLMATFP
ncbi:conserved hypothetical protein [Candidatus Terasakiella magnetica]|nr:conserved hypothetical protein [Candidatus Terasakiella magnetica]